jgi:beta-phosphoglucomutase
MFAKHKRMLDPKTMLRVLTRKSEACRELIETRQYAALPGVEEFVRGLWRHYPLAICSGALREEIESMLEGVHLRDCFRVIVSAEDVKKGKPDPEGYLLAAERVRRKTGLSFTPEDCLVVEDAPTVIHSANAEGFQTLAVATSYPLEAMAHATYRVARLTPAQVLKQIPTLKIGV